MTRALKERSIMSMETKRPGPEAQRTPEENYEHSDANVGGVLKSAIWLAALLVVVFLSMRWTFNKMSEMEPMGAAASPFVDSRQMPPAPRLQVDPQKEISDYCATQAASLNSYGWKDSKAGIVQIPVDRAIDLMVEHPLPARAGGDVPSGVNPLPSMIPPVADVSGQCGYVTARDEAKAAAEEEGKKESGK
jgi:hypothetical protein